MKLYFSPGTCSLSPQIILNETKTPITLVKTDIRAKKVDGGADFRDVNPLGAVPALELDDGTILTEGPAIVQYIADQAGATDLAPANGSLERYQMQSWLNMISSELHKGFAPLFNDKMPEAARQLFKDKLGERFAFLDKHFATKHYLMGDKFTLPDAYAYTVMRWAAPMQIDLAKYPNVVAFMDRVKARPAVQAALQAEGLN